MSYASVNCTDLARGRRALRIQRHGDAAIQWVCVATRVAGISVAPFDHRRRPALETPERDFCWTYRVPELDIDFYGLKEGEMGELQEMLEFIGLRCEVLWR